MDHKDYFEIVIAGITIRFQTNHQSDIDCLEGLFSYHKTTNNMPYEEEKIVHNVIINSSSKQLELPKDTVSVWEGFVSTEYSISMVWHNSMIANENFITVGKDIIIHHIPASRLTTCYLQEKRRRLGKSHRPLLNIYIFLLTHNILSMYGKYSIHSACMAKNGYAYLFLGKSGEGKSTISTLLGTSGFEYMGDDLAFISQNKDGEIMIDAFLSKMKQQNEKSNTKNAIDAIKEKHFKYTYQSKLGAVIKLQRTHASDKSVLIPATQTESFVGLIHSGNNIKMQYHPQLWLDICEQASLLPSFTLMFADKASFNPDILHNALNK